MAEHLTTRQQGALQRASDRVSEQGWGLALGLLSAIALFIMTALLLIKGGARVGEHLNLLGIYLPGYDVTWPGAFIGAVEAFVVAYAGGRLVAMIYNRLITR